MTFDPTLIQKYLQPRGVLALDVDSDGVVGCLVRRGDAPLPSFTLSLPGLLDAPQKSGIALAKALEAADLHERRCVVCIPPSWALSASADLPEVSAEDLRGYFELRAEREFSSTGLRLAHSRYALPDGTPRATLVGVPAKRIEALEQLLATAGCRVVSLSLALNGCLAAPEPTLHFLARREAIDVLVSIGGGIALLRSMAGGTDGSALARELRITLGRLPEAVRQQVTRARWVGPSMPGLRERLEPLGMGDLAEEPQPDAPSAGDCAALYLSQRPVPFEFVIPLVNHWPARFERFNTKLGRRIAAGTTALFLLLILVFITRSHMESSLNTEWDGMRNGVAELDALQQNIRRFRPWFAGSPQKLQALETLFAAFPEKGEVWARSVQIAAYQEKSENSSRMVVSTEASKVTVSGFTRSQAALMGLQEHLRKEPGVSALQLQQLRGNNPIQFSLTFKWESKHDL